jgi:hypothetical protein
MKIEFEIFYENSKTFLQLQENFPRKLKSELKILEFEDFEIMTVLPIIKKLNLLKKQSKIKKIYWKKLQIKEHSMNPNF